MPHSAPAVPPPPPLRVHSAAILEEPRGVSLHLRTEDGTLVQLPLEQDVLAEIAALAGAALARGAMEMVAQGMPAASSR